MTMIQPLRLAVGSHKAGSGKGCAMNVVSWENGDTTITDLPRCADPFLARVVHRVNDKLCTHRAGDLLCPPCSLKVLALAHRTVGTALDWPHARRARLYAELAVEQAESVLHFTEGDRPRLACALARRFLAGEAVTSQALAIAGNAAYAPFATAAQAAHAAAQAADAEAVTNAAYATVEASIYAASVADATLSGAHHVIDRFEAFTGVRAQPTPAETTARAIAAMTAT